VPEDGGVEVKPMFGNVGAFVNGSMFMGLFGPEERPMSGYVTLPRGLSRARAQSWVAQSLDHVGARPPKRGRRS
jgi:hypothetical protein